MLICFVGIDGSGKTLQAERLAEALAARGISCAYVWCRYGRKLLLPLILLIRRRFHRKTGDYDGFTSSKKGILSKPLLGWIWLNVSILEYLLQVTSAIRIRLIGGKTLICDRYIYDALADLAISLDCRDDGILKIARHPLIRLFPKPARVYFLDVPPAVAFRRKNDPNVMAEEYLVDRARVYSFLSDELGFMRIDGTKSIEEIAEFVLSDAVGCIEGGGAK
jgi:thymidylate kinase